MNVSKNEISLISFVPAQCIARRWDRPAIEMLKLFTFVTDGVEKWRYDIQHNDTQHNDTQHNDTQHNNTQHNNTQHNNTQHKDTQHKNTQHKDTQHKDTQHKDTQHNGTFVMLCVFYTEGHLS
jgi:hypothetical protein